MTPMAIEGARAPMDHLDLTERWGFGVCFLIGLRQAKDRGGMPPWPQEQYLPLGLCCPSPWLVDLIFPEVCGLSQNGSTSYLRHTCVIPLTQFWAERACLFGYRAEPAMNEGAAYWTTASCAADWR